MQVPLNLSLTVLTNCMLLAKVFAVIAAVLQQGLVIFITDLCLSMLPPQHQLQGILCYAFPVLLFHPLQHITHSVNGTVYSTPFVATCASSYLWSACLVQLMQADGALAVNARWQLEQFGLLELLVHPVVFSEIDLKSISRCSFASPDRASGVRPGVGYGIYRKVCACDLDKPQPRPSAVTGRD